MVGACSLWLHCRVILPSHLSGNLNVRLFIFSLGLVGPQRRPFQSPARILGAEWKNLGVSDSPFPLLFFRIHQSSIVLPQRVISVSCHGDGGAVRCWKGRSLGTPYLLNRISPPSPTSEQPGTTHSCLQSCFSTLSC